MKFLRIAAAAAFMFGATSAWAFHSGGVAECGGCHAMHKADTSGNIIGAANTTLLNNSSVSSTCFDCHSGPTLSSYHELTWVNGGPIGSGLAPVNRTPGGDFGWLLKTYTYTPRGTPGTPATVYSPGGHHVDAAPYQIYAETGTAPGGTFPASSLGCSSCHDPHGKARTDANGAFVAVNAYKIIGSGSYATLQAPANGETAISAYGTYRLLYTANSYYTGAGYAGPIPATIAAGAVTFSQAPLAVAPATYNQVENVNQVIVRYASNPGRTVALWCASCHPAMHTANTANVHPQDAALGTGGEAGYYNAYVNSGNKTGVVGSSYLSLVPFAMSGAARATLAAAATYTSPTGAGPAAADQVMCLSCHRAHASAFQNDIRWDYDGGEFITYVQTLTNNPVWPGTDTTPDIGKGSQYAGGRSSAETQAGYYDRPVTMFGAYQRQLCNKCHLQD